MANHCQIIRGMVFSDTRMVFIEGYIETIMESILDPPMLSHGRCSRISVKWELRHANDFRSQRSEPDLNGERSHRDSGLALAGCRGNAKMDDRREAERSFDSHRRR